MSVPAVGAASLASSVSLPTAGVSTPAATDGAGFAQALAGGLQNVQDVQSKADQLGVQAATGDLKDVHDYMIAATQAELTTELTVTLRNKALEAFNEIMRMQG
jgi:flagellar hook-basal body complex protein FliE